jgi:hypothetical protein
MIENDPIAENNLDVEEARNGRRPARRIVAKHGVNLPALPVTSRVVDRDWSSTNPLLTVGRFQVAWEAEHFKLSGLTVHTLAFHWYSR